MGKTSFNRLNHKIKSWRIGDYFRQFSIVAAGIIVTFWGNDRITENARQKEVRATMQLVTEELEYNRQELRNIKHLLDIDIHMSLLLREHDMDVSKIPTDTLWKYGKFFNNMDEFSWKIAKKIYDPEQFPQASDIILRGTNAGEGSKKEKTKGVASIRINGLKAGERTVSIEVCKGEIVLVSREAAPIDCFWDQCQRSSDSGLEFIIDGKKVASHTMADLVKNRVGMISCEISRMGVMRNLTKEDNILMPSYRKISGRLGFYRKASSYILRDNFLFEDGEALDDIDFEKNGWKLVFYRWKLFNPRVLIVHNCITAADLWERDWIKKRLIEMAERGTAVILLENEAAFCSGFSDRVWTVDKV